MNLLYLTAFCVVLLLAPGTQSCNDELEDEEDFYDDDSTDLYTNKLLSSTPIATEDDDDDKRIVNGRNIYINEAPWMVAMFSKGNFNCGGSVVSKMWVLTAAHCVQGLNRKKIYIRAGSRFYNRGGQTRSITRIVVHPNWNDQTYNADLAMMRLKTGLDLSTPRVRAVRLAGPGANRPPYYFVTGWGAIGENKALSPGLLGVQLKFVQRTTCARSYGKRGIPVTKNMVCAAAPNKDSCQGDSGGPLTHSGTLYATVSFGIGCARKQYPSVNTDIRRYSGWVKRVMKTYSGRSID